MVSSLCACRYVQISSFYSHTRLGLILSNLILTWSPARNLFPNQITFTGARVRTWLCIFRERSSTHNLYCSLICFGTFFPNGRHRGVIPCKPLRDGLWYGFTVSSPTPPALTGVFQVASNSSLLQTALQLALSFIVASVSEASVPRNGL